MPKLNVKKPGKKVEAQGAKKLPVAPLKKAKTDTPAPGAPDKRTVEQILESIELLLKRGMAFLVDAKPAAAPLAPVGVPPAARPVAAGVAPPPCSGALRPSPTGLASPIGNRSCAMCPVAGRPPLP